MLAYLKPVAISAIPPSVRCTVACREQVIRDLLQLIIIDECVLLAVDLELCAWVWWIPERANLAIDQIRRVIRLNVPELGEHLLGDIPSICLWRTSGLALHEFTKEINNNLRDDR